MSGLGKNNANGADRAGSVWMIANAELERPSMINPKSQHVVNM
jgi:hypothetical protein